MGKIKTFKEQRYAIVALGSGETVMLSVARERVAIFKMQLYGLLPGPRIAAWAPKNFNRFRAKFGKGSREGSAFRATVEFIASFSDLKALQSYISEPPR
jgi:hypothetical protein